MSSYLRLLGELRRTCGGCMEVSFCQPFLRGLPRDVGRVVLRRSVVRPLCVSPPLHSVLPCQVPRFAGGGGSFLSHIMSFDTLHSGTLEICTQERDPKEGCPLLATKQRYWRLLSQKPPRAVENGATANIPLFSPFRSGAILESGG